MNTVATEAHPAMAEAASAVAERVAAEENAEKVRATFNLDRRELEALQRIARAKGIPVTAVLRQMIRDMTMIQDELAETQSKMIIESPTNGRVQLVVPSFRID